MRGAIAQVWEICQLFFLVDEKGTVEPIELGRGNWDARAKGSLWHRSL
jgi:hypothetical protein